MRRKLKYTGFSIGLIMLFLIITLKFIEDDNDEFDVKGIKLIY